MDKQKVLEVLNLLAPQISHIDWVLSGGSNLLIQDVDIGSVHDIDIETDMVGMRELQKMFAGTIIKNPVTNEEFHSFSYKGIQIEVIHHLDRKHSQLDHKKPITIEGLELPVVPLKKALEQFRFEGFREKASVVEKHLENRRL